MQDLADGRSPDTLFIACVDSRVNPNLITSSGPGDMLSLRNIGNVLCQEGQDPSTESALSFALNALAVQSIVVCGHSNCGAMKAVIEDAAGAAPGLGHSFDTWLGHARPSYRELLGGHPVAAAAAAAGYKTLDQLGMVSVAVQLDRLRQHPIIGPALAEGRVQAAGLFYDISTARVIRVHTDGIDALGPTPAAAPVSQAAP